MMAIGVGPIQGVMIGFEWHWQTNSIYIDLGLLRIMILYNWTEEALDDYIK